MKRRESLMIALLIVSLLAAIVLAAVQQARPSERELAADSISPNGARALALWLETLGFTVNAETPAGAFTVPPNVEVIFLLEPTVAITNAEWKELDAWITAGGELVLIGDGPQAREAFQHYDIALTRLLYPLTKATAATALWGNPSLTTTVEVRTSASLDLQREDVAPLLASGNDIVLLTFSQGQGRVILGTVPFSFSNAGLREAGNPEVILNLLARMPRSGEIWFDEWHHGQRSRAVTLQGPADWLRFTSSGRAVLYAALITFVVLLLQGRAFGRPVPLPRTTQRRGVLEHVTALAQLSRRAGHRTAELHYYHIALKRHLGRRYRLDPTLPDGTYVQQLGTMAPDLDAEALKHLLEQLSHPHADEETLVRLAREAARWMAS